MNEEAAATLAAADVGLNKVYQTILNDYKKDPAALENFRQSQRDWLKEVSSIIAKAYPLKKGENPRVVYGSMYPLDVASMRTQLTVARIRDLQTIGGKKEFDVAKFCRENEITLEAPTEKKQEKESPKTGDKLKSLGF
jgi:uncharacterized protein YecT (DUF1311 family)